MDSLLQDVRYGARFSVTNAESTFHTDNSFGTEVLDYVGLLCLNTARSGGEKSSAAAVPSAYWPFHISSTPGIRKS